jgi:hypothetical protein
MRSNSACKRGENGAPRVRLPTTASRSTLGFMNEMAFERRYAIADAGGPGRCDIDILSHGLRRTLRNRGE